MTDQQSRWESFILKVQDVTSNRLGKSRHGLVAVSVRLIVNHDGEPVVWLDPDCWRIEPSTDVAKALLGYLVDK